MPRQYIIDYGRLTWSERIRLLGWKIPSWMLGRALGAMPTRSEPFKVGFPMADTEVPAEGVPPRARDDVAGFVREATTAGCQGALYQAMYQPDQETVNVVMRHASGRFALRLIVVRGLAVDPPLVRVVIGVLSRLADGRWLATGNQAKKFDDNPGIIVHRLPGGSLAEVVSRHERGLADLAGTSPVPILSADDLRAAADDYERYCFEQGCRRGLFVEVEASAPPPPS